MKKLILMTAVSGILLSCNQQQPILQPVVPQYSNGELNKRVKIKIAENPNNPFDSIGIWHNSILDSLRSYEHQTGDTTRSGHNRYLEQFAKKYRHTNIKLSRLPVFESAIRKDFKKVLLSQPLSESAKKMLMRLVGVLENIQSTNSFNEYKQKIENQEIKIIASPLPKMEKGLLLVTASMLRHSGYYWMNVFNELPENNTRKNGFLRKLLGAISSVGADVTTAAYHYAKNTRPDGIILEASRMSYICGYYTGWYDNQY
jgi:hypothetical protein